MKRVTRDKTIPVHSRYTIHKPVLDVDLDESFLVETINFRTPIIRTPKDANPKEYREREETGPIYINGIDAGDVLAIHIEAIKPEGHASGLWWDDPNMNSFLRIENNKVYFPGGLWALQHMMIGDISVTPAKGWDSVGGNPWDNGGNMDFKDVAPGYTLYLRSELKGGLLVLGDVHACQGDGELSGLGAECAATVQLRITKDETFLPERPMIKKPNSFIAIACRRDYGEAWQLAARDASKILSRIVRVTENEAFLYCMTVGNLRNGAIWSMGTKNFRTKYGWGPPPLVVGLEVPLYLKDANH
jgi:amidase